MRILWFTNTPSNYNLQNSGYNGGGWISSLETEIKKNREIDLAVCFHMSNQPFKIESDNVTYYPIELPKQNKLKTLINILSETYPIRDKEIDTFLQIVNDFKPDLIEIFGSERSFGLISKFVDIPVILHIQGIINPYYNAFLPPFFSWTDYIIREKMPHKIFKNYLNKKKWIIQCKQEAEILKNVKYYIGRTEWDKRITKIYNPECQYFYGSEILRSCFYESSTRNLPSKLIIVTTISDPLYKGFDLILKTAYLLKNKLKMDFVWKVFGNISPTFIEDKTKIKYREVNIKLMGVGNAHNIKNELLQCTCFFHPSYIDNSPNSICEAQLLGCPVISTEVGGISSLIEDGKTGFLIPANDPYQAAFLIKELFIDVEKNISIGNSAGLVAKQRHDKIQITTALHNLYCRILSEMNIKKKH